MEIVAVSPKFQIVIPRAARQALDTRLGQRFQAVWFDDRIELIPARPIRE